MYASWHSGLRQPINIILVFEMASFILIESNQNNYYVIRFTIARGEYRISVTIQTKWSNSNHLKIQLQIFTEVLTTQNEHTTMYTCKSDLHVRPFLECQQTAAHTFS